METKTNAKGDIILTISGSKYIFRQPTGRDLVALERIVKDGDSTDAETLAAIMAQLSADGHDADFFLDLPLAVFKEVGAKILDTFRSSDSNSV